QQQPPQGNQTQNQPQTSANDGGGSGSTSGDDLWDDGTPFDATRARQLITRLRPFEGQVAALRDELDQAKTKLKEFEDAQLTEQQKLVRDLEEANAHRQRLSEENTRLRAENALTLAGCNAPELIASQIPEDAIANTEKLNQVVTQLKGRYPTLFGTLRPQGTVNGGDGQHNPLGEQTDMNSLLRRATGRA